MFAQAPQLKSGLGGQFLLGDLREEDLAAVPRRHHSRSAVDWRSEIVAAPGVDLSRVDGHPDTEIEVSPVDLDQPLLGVGRGDHGTHDRRKCRHHPVAHVLEEASTGVVNDVCQDVIVLCQRRAHGWCSRLPQLGGPCDVGEQKSDILGDRVPARYQVGIVVQDPELQFDQAGRRIDSELLPQVLPPALECSQCLGLPAVSV